LIALPSSAFSPHGIEQFDIQTVVGLISFPWVVGRLSGREEMAAMTFSFYRGVGFDANVTDRASGCEFISGSEIPNASIDDYDSTTVTASWTG